MSNLVLSLNPWLWVAAPVAYAGAVTLIILFLSGATKRDQADAAWAAEMRQRMAEVDELFGWADETPDRIRREWGVTPAPETLVPLEIDQDLAALHFWHVEDGTLDPDCPLCGTNVVDLKDPNA